MNRLSYILPYLSTKSTRSYDFKSLFSILESSGYSPRRVGKEIKANIDGHVYAINPTKGLWIGSAGSGTLSGLLKKLHLSSYPLPLAQPAETEEEKNFGKNQRKISEKLRDSVVLREINEKSPVTDRLSKKIVSDYLASRGLSVDLLPSEARIRKDQQGFYELLVPLLTDGDAISVHVTALDSNGKHGLSWLGGDCRYSLGPMSGAFAVIEGDKERLEIKGKEGVNWFCVGEGLETVMSVRLLTGWTTIFAVSAPNLLHFLTQEMIEKLRQHNGGLAIVVDRDTSGTGQKAAGKLAALAKEAEIPVLFLVPPGIVEGGPKGADWNDALKLGKDKAFGALVYAIGQSDEELSKVEVGKVVKIDNVRESSEPQIVSKTRLNEAQAKVWTFAKNHVESWEEDPGILGVTMGSGKSKILSDLAKNHQYVGAPLAIITPTRELALESALKADGFFREGRSEIPENNGFCFIYPDVLPFSEKMRSIVAHQCHPCGHGKAAMATIRGEQTEERPCSYILHTHESRSAQVLNTTAAMIEGDPGVTTIKMGEKVQNRKIILDDTCVLADHRTVHGGHFAEWIRASQRIIEMAGSGEEATKNLLPHLSALARFLADHPGEEQIRVNPEDWSEFSKIVKSSKVKWMDGVTAEAIFRDGEGKLEIPLRTLRDLGEALARGTAYVRKGILHFAASTEAFEALLKGALILDATPTVAMKECVTARGGKVMEIFVRQDSLRVQLIPSGNHGKTACSPESPSYEREKKHFINSVKALEDSVGAENLAVLSHKSFVESLGEDCGISAEIGHWGLDDRGHNRWKTKKALLVWGVQQLSPSTAERVYMAERQAVIEAGGAAWPEWNGERKKGWYRIPGMAKEIFASGYKDEFIDKWHREWVTARLVQAIGRLRAARRTEEPLRVVVNASFPFLEAFGLEFSSVEKPDWRTMNDYRQEKKNDRTERAVIAAVSISRNLDDVSFRLLNQKMKDLFGKGVSAREYKELREEIKGVTTCEYSLFPTGNTCDLLGKDIEKVLERLEVWKDFSDFYNFSLEEMFNTVEPAGDSPVDRVVWAIFRRVFGTPDPDDQKEVG